MCVTRRGWVSVSGVLFILFVFVALNAGCVVWFWIYPRALKKQRFFSFSFGGKFFVSFFLFKHLFIFGFAWHGLAAFFWSTTTGDSHYNKWHGERGVRFEAREGWW